MLNRIVSGMLFGFGFSVSLVLVLSIWMKYVLPVSFESISPEIISSKTLPVSDEYPLIRNFSELPLDEKIANSTAISATQIAKDSEGMYRTTVIEVLKKAEGVDLYYNVGDTFDDYSDYNKYEAEGRSVPQGFIVFMGGNPAQMRFSTSYSGERVGGLGGITMDLLREKCSL